MDMSDIIKSESNLPNRYIAAKRINFYDFNMTL